MGGSMGGIGRPDLPVRDLNHDDPQPPSDDVGRVLWGGLR